MSDEFTVIIEPQVAINTLNACNAALSTIYSSIPSDEAKALRPMIYKTMKKCFEILSTMDKP